MTLTALFTLGVVINLLVTLVFSRLATGMVLMGGLVALLLAGIVFPEQAFSGFPTPA